jgi:P27 family predicted phage terminase small subunit
VKGRPPKPVEQKIREGNPGKRALPEPLKLNEGKLVKPSGLPKAAAALWDELVPVLEVAGVSDRVDRAALTAMCHAWADSCAARKLIAKQGRFVPGSMGQLVEHPAVATARNSDAMFLRYAEQFGLTPAARARIAFDVSLARQAQEAELAEVLDLTPAEMDD